MNPVEVVGKMEKKSDAATWTTLDKLARLVRDVGFPILVAGYLLLSLGPKVDRAIEKLERVVVVLEARK